MITFAFVIPSGAVPRPAHPRSPLLLAAAGRGMSRRPDALRGPTEPHLRLPRHRGEREQRQVPASLLHPGHSARKLGVVYGQPTGGYTVFFTQVLL